MDYKSTLKPRTRSMNLRVLDDEDGFQRVEFEEGVWWCSTVTARFDLWFLPVHNSKVVYGKSKS